MEIPDRIIDQITAIGIRYPIKKIVLFGSRSRGDNKPRSDIDLAIYPFVPFAQPGLLAADIEELDTLLKIDFVLITPTTDPQLLNIIEKEGVVLYERST